MALGVLDTHDRNRSVPGTSQLEVAEGIHAGRSTHVGGINAEVVLRPQPSASPNDPLNWPLWQRDLVLVLLMYCTNICVGGVGPLVSTIAVPILKEFHVNYKAVSLLTGYQLAVIGAIAPIVSALSRKYGKRPLYLVSSVFLLAGSMVCASASSYNVLLAGRLLQGAGTAAFESITFSAVGDMYFIHQRGLRMALYTSSAVGLVLFPSLIAGVVATSLTWRWSFWLLTIFTGAAAIGILFFGWETTFNRTEDDGIVIPVQAESTRASASGTEQAEDAEKSEVQQLERSTTSAPSLIGTRDSFITRVKPWSGSYDNEPLVRILIRPALLLVNPVVSWAIIFNAFAQLWNVFISITLAQLFSPPPYSLNTAQLGYLNAGPIIAGLTSCVVCGVLSDWLVLFMSSKNNGVYEPEFRLLLLILAPIFSSVGFFLFGHLSATGGSPALLSFVWGIGFASAQVVGSATGSYLVDAYREIDVDIFVVSMSVKNFLFFGFSFFMNDWIAVWGSARVFNCVGGVMLGLSFTTIPVYLYGKRVRAWWYSRGVFGAKLCHATRNS